MKRRAVLLAAGLALTGCTQPAEKAAPAQPAAQVVSASPAAPAKPVTPKSLKFSGTTLEGAAFDAASLAGKPALLWFWAPWCATCASEAQSIADVQEEYGDRLGILGIAGMGTKKAMNEFVSDFQLQAVPHLNDPAGKIWQRFGIAQQSWYVLIDPDGKILHTGYLDDLQLTEKVRAVTA
ncbi:redoxin domain-containing protein [Actinoplanes aureus]|uniref:Redoxin domain-containing protein n=1 Tax=Actinoplanes aureus TaxID=2792083 RepID=A0A931FWZ2_9ACTN|nr:redoxin domain-containing protein [Actinoplanes aureus]MBG0562963.1 redoxin domain-containing protein [Actinoplanes aureus]